MNEILKYIFNDIAEALKYLPYGVIAGAIIRIIIELYEKFIYSKDNPGKKICRKNFIFSWTVYLIVIVMLTFFSREPGSRTDVNMRLFGTWGTYAQAHAYVIENILLFVPFGIMFPMIGKKAGNIFICIIAAALFSIIIETMQYVTARGFCQMDDIVMNTLGALTGWIGWQICRKIIR